MEQKIGFIGLGQMGKWMASNLLKTGFKLTVFDIDTHARTALTDLGAIGVDTPVALAEQADVIFLSLPDAQVIHEAVCGADGIIQTTKAGRIIVDCGTTDYLWTIDFAEKMSRMGIRFVDAPVTGMARRAKEATLTIMFGGPKKILEEVRPALEVMGNRIVHMGDAGSGQLAKLMNQLLFNINLAAIAEILPVAVKLGLDPEKTARVINSGSGRSFASEFFIPNILKDWFDQGYSLENGYKDMAAALEISAADRIPMPMVQTATAVYQSALSAGLGRQDKGAMIKVFERLLNVKFRKPMLT